MLAVEGCGGGVDMAQAAKPTVELALTSFLPTGNSMVGCRIWPVGMRNRPSSPTSAPPVPSASASRTQQPGSRAHLWLAGHRPFTCGNFVCAQGKRHCRPVSPLAGDELFDFCWLNCLHAPRKGSGSDIRHDHSKRPSWTSYVQSTFTVFVRGEDCK